MARLKVLGMKLYLGDDDLGITQLFHILIHVVWTICAIFCCILYKEVENSLVQFSGFSSLISIQIALVVLSIILEGWIVSISVKGIVLEELNEQSHKRKKIFSLFNIHSCLLVVTDIAGFISSEYMFRHIYDNPTSFYTFLVTLMCLSLIEFCFSIIFTLLFLSPRLTEKRIRRILRYGCCGIIKDNEVLDSLVFTMSSLPSFKDFSLSDILLGLLMTNMIYYDKKEIIKGIDDPDERLRVKKMRVHEYIEYVNSHSDLSFTTKRIRRSALSGRDNSLLATKRLSLKVSAKESTPIHSSSTEIELFNSSEVIVDEHGEQCVVLKHEVDDDILQDIDIEKSAGCEVFNRLQYRIDKGSIKYLEHMGIYANAVYGFSLAWLNSYVDKNATSFVKQMSQLSRETSMKDYNQLKITIQSSIHDIGGRLIYCSDANIIGRTPWFIAYDETYDAVVISIRGTWSLKDCITDLLVELKPLDDAGIEYDFDGRNEYTHQGVYSVATEVLHDLNHLHLLSILFKKTQEERDPNIILPPEVLEKITSSTKLVVVGHSLGGSAASLLSIFLQSTYPNTCCAYDPPGETLSPGLRERTRHFITTTVFGHDIFPRVSSYTLSILQDNIVGSLCMCKLSKIRFYMNLLFNRMDIPSTFFKSVSKLSQEKQMMLDSWLEQSEHHVKEVAKECYLPGNIVYVRFDKLTVKTKKGKKKIVREFPVHAVAEEFLDLRLGKNFFVNHWVFLFPIWLRHAGDHLPEQ